MLILLLAIIFAILSQFLLIFKKYDICSHCVPIASSLHLKCLLFQAGLQLKSICHNPCLISRILGSAERSHHHPSWNACFSRRDCNSASALSLLSKVSSLKCLLFQAGLQLKILSTRFIGKSAWNACFSRRDCNRFWKTCFENAGFNSRTSIDLKCLLFQAGLQLFYTYIECSWI